MDTSQSKYMMYMNEQTARRKCSMLLIIREMEINTPMR